jgi:hypothetical protein
MKNTNTYINAEIALLYYKELGIYYTNSVASRHAAKNRFCKAKAEKRLDKDVLNKALEKYFEKIKQDFE